MKRAAITLFLILLCAGPLRSNGAPLQETDDPSKMQPPYRFGEIVVVMDGRSYFPILGGNNLSLEVGYNPGSMEVSPTEKQLLQGLFIVTGGKKCTRIPAGSDAEETVFDLLKTAAANTYHDGHPEDDHTDSTPAYYINRWAVARVMCRIQERRTLVAWKRNGQSENASLTTDPTKLTAPLTVQNVIAAMTGPNYLVISGANGLRLKLIMLSFDYADGSGKKLGDGNLYLVDSTGKQVRIRPGSATAKQVIEAAKTAITNTYGGAKPPREITTMRKYDWDSACWLLEKLAPASSYPLHMP